MAIIFGLYMTWGIGANDVANAMGTSVGSGAITVKQAIIIAAIFEFAGAFIAGGTVTKTIRKGIIDPAPITGSAGAAGLRHAGGAAGGGDLADGRLDPRLAGVHHPHHRRRDRRFRHGRHRHGCGQLGQDRQIVASWLVSPLLGGIIALLLMISIRKLILNADNPFDQAKTWGPMYVFLVGLIVSLVTMFKGLKHLKLELSIAESFIAATVFGIIVAIIGKMMINKVKVDASADKDFHYASVEKVFTPMMVFTACAMAFAHGSNDVANGIGPLAAVVVHRRQRR